MRGREQKEGDGGYIVCEGGRKNRMRGRWGVTEAREAGGSAGEGISAV